MSKKQATNFMLFAPLVVLLLASCGGHQTPSDLDYFKDDIVALDGPIILGELHSLPVRIVHDDVYTGNKALYACVNLGAQVMSSVRYAMSGEYLIYDLEEDEGEYQHDGVTFTFGIFD